MVVSGRYSKGWSIVALVLARRVYYLYKNSGLRFVSQYLQSCQISLMRFMSESPRLEGSDRLTTWCSCTRSGLPVIIPASHRKVLRKRDVEAQKMAQIYLTIFGFHRVFYRKHTHPDLVNIVKGFKLNPDDKDLWDDLQLALRTTLPELIYATFPCVREIQLGLDWRPSWSSGPATGPIKPITNVMALGLDAASYIALYENALETAQALNMAPGGNPRYRFPGTLLDLGEMWYPKRVHVVGEPLLKVDHEHFIQFCYDCLPSDCSQLELFQLSTFGRLGRKYEGGGKIRVFSIVDSIRQSCLRPVHDWAMNLLKLIPSDGTFDQTAPLHRLIRLTKGKGPMFCFDLSAATDRFPARLQKEVLTWAFGDEASEFWLRVIRDRPFEAPWRRRKQKTAVSFGVGQPLGAYSSWPVFSLTHHLLIQYCAKAHISGKWFNRYALLGDDVVIADREVATKYLDLMRCIGVEISNKKSLISDHCCVEFAKRFMMGTRDLSPISFKSVFSLIPPVVGSMVTRITQFRSVRRSEPYRWLGAGYRIRSRCLYPKDTGMRWKRFHLLLTSPKGPFPLPHLWWHSQYASRPVTEQDIAVVRAYLLNITELNFNPSLGIYEGLTGEDVRESLVLGKWLKTYFSLITDFLLELIKSNDLTPWYSRPTMASNPFRVERIVLLRYGMMFRCWERVHRLVRKPSLLRLTS